MLQRLGSRPGGKRGPKLSRVQMVFLRVGDKHDYTRQVALTIVSGTRQHPPATDRLWPFKSEGVGLVTHQYELMVILDPEIDERTVAPSLDKFLNVIRNDGGTIDNVDIWGRRRLAYEINKKTEGIYAVVNFTATSAATNELDRQLSLSEAVMRTKVLRAEEGIAQVAAAKAAAEEKAARKAAAPAKPVAADAAAADTAAAE